MSRAAAVMIMVLFAVLCLNYAPGTSDPRQDPNLTPTDPPLIGPFPGLYTRGFVEVANCTFSGYEFVLSVHAPLNSTRNPQTGRAPSELRGQLHILNLHNAVNNTCGCSSTNNFTNQFVMVKCGACKLSLQREHCHFEGAAALIFNEDEQPLPILDGGKTHAITLPSFAFDRLSKFAGQEASMWALSSPSDISLFRLLIVLLIRPLVVLALLLTLFFFSMRNKHKHHRMPPETLQRLPTRVWQNTAVNRWHQTQCSICLEDFESECEVTVLPCGHEFHKSCVSRWLLTRRGACPLCMQDIPNEQTPLLAV